MGIRDLVTNRIIKCICGKCKRCKNRVYARSRYSKVLEPYKRNREDHWRRRIEPESEMTKEDGIALDEKMTQYFLLKGWDKEPKWMTGL